MQPNQPNQPKSGSSNASQVQAESNAQQPKNRNAQANLPLQQNVLLQSPQNQNQTNASSNQGSNSGHARSNIASNSNIQSQTVSKTIQEKQSSLQRSAHNQNPNGTNSLANSSNLQQKTNNQSSRQDNQSQFPPDEQSREELPQRNRFNLNNALRRFQIGNNANNHAPLNTSDLQSLIPEGFERNPFQDTNLSNSMITSVNRSNLQTPQKKDNYFDPRSPQADHLNQQPSSSLNNSQMNLSAAPFTPKQYQASASSQRPIFQAGYFNSPNNSNLLINSPTQMNNSASDSNVQASTLQNDEQQLPNQQNPTLMQPSQHLQTNFFNILDLTQEHLDYYRKVILPNPQLGPSIFTLAQLNCLAELHQTFNPNQHLYLARARVRIPQNPINLDESPYIDAAQNPINLDASANASIGVSQNPINLDASASIGVSQNPINLDASANASIGVAQNPINIDASANASLSSNLNQENPILPSAPSNPNVHAEQKDLKMQTPNPDTQKNQLEDLQPPEENTEIRFRNFNAQFENSKVTCLICMQDREGVRKNNNDQDVDWTGCSQCTALICEPCFNNYRQETCRYKSTIPCPSCNISMDMQTSQELKQAAIDRIRKIDQDAERELIGKSNNSESQVIRNQNLNANANANANKDDVIMQDNQAQLKPQDQVSDQKMSEENKENDSSSSSDKDLFDNTNAPKEKEEGELTSSSSSSEDLFQDIENKNHQTGLHQSNSERRSLLLLDQKILPNRILISPNQLNLQIDADVNMQEQDPDNNQIQSRNIQTINQQSLVFSWEEFLMIYRKYKMKVENFLYYLLFQDASKYINPSKNKVSLIYIQHVKEYKHAPSVFIAQFCGGSKGQEAKRSRELVKNFMNETDEYEKSYIARDDDFIKELLEELMPEYQMPINDIPFRSHLKKLTDESGVEIIIPSLNEAIKKRDEIKNVIQSKSRVSIDNDNKTEQDLEMQIVFYQRLLNLRRRNNVLYNGNINIYDRKVVSELQNSLENSLNKLYDVSIEAMRQIRLKGQHKQNFRDLKSQINEILRQKIREVWNSVIKYISIPSFESCLDNIRNDREAMQYLEDIDGSEALQRNLTRTSINEIQEENAIQEQLLGQDFNFQNDFPDKQRESNSASKIEGGTRKLTPLKQATGSSLSQKRLRQNNRSNRSINTHLNVENPNFITSYTSSVDQSVKRTNDKNQFMYQANKAPIQNRQNRLTQVTDDKIQDDVDNFIQNGNSVNIQRYQAAQTEKIKNQLESQQKVKKDKQSQIIPQQNQQPAHQTKQDRKQQQILDSQYRRAVPNASQEKRLPQNWKQKEREQIAKQNLDAFKNSLQHNQKYQALINKKQLEEQLLFESLQKQQAIKIQRQHEIQNEHQFQQIPSNLHEKVPLKDLNKYLYERRHIYNSNQQIRLKVGPACHQVCFKNEKKVNGQLQQTIIQKFSRKALKQAFFTFSDAPENCMISYTYNDFRAPINRNISTRTHLLQVYLNIGNGVVGNKKPLHGNVFTQSFQTDAQINNLFGNSNQDQEEQVINRRRTSKRSASKGDENISMKSLIQQDLVLVFNNLDLEGWNLALKLIRPWGPCQEREEHQCSIINNKARQEIVMKVRNCSKLNELIQNPSDEDLDKNELFGYLRDGLHIDKETAIHAFGDDRRNPVYFNANAEDMRILSHQDDYSKWIPETEFRNNNYANLNLQIQDDFPVLHLRISFLDRSRNQLKYDILSTDPTNDENLIVQHENVNVVQVQQMLTQLKAQHRNIFDSMDQERFSGTPAPAILPNKPNAYHDYVNEEFQSFNSGQIRQNLNIAIKQEDNLPDFANSIKGQNSFSSRFLALDQDDRQKVFKGFNQYDGFEVWEGDELQNLMGKNRLQINPNCEARDALSKNRAKMDAQRSNNLHKKSQIKEVSRKSAIFNQQNGEQSYYQREEQVSNHSQSRGRRSRKNGQFNLRIRQISETQSAAPSQTDQNQNNASAQAVPFSRQRKQYNANEDQDEYFFKISSDNENAQQLAQHQLMTRARRQEVEQKELQKGQNRKEIFQQIVNPQFNQPFLQESQSSSDANAAEEDDEGEQISPDINFRVTHNSRRQLYQSQPFKKFSGRPSMPPNQQQNQANMNLRIVENMLLSSKANLQDALKKEQDNEEMEELEEADLTFGARSYLMNKFKNSFLLISELTDPAQIWSINDLKEKKSDFEILLEPKVINGKEVYDVLLSMPLRFRIENLTQNNTESIISRSMNRSVDASQGKPHNTSIDSSSNVSPQKALQNPKRQKMMQQSQANLESFRKNTQHDQIVQLQIPGLQLPPNSNISPVLQQQNPSGDKSGGKFNKSLKKKNNADNQAPFENQAQVQDPRSAEAPENKMSGKKRASKQISKTNEKKKAHSQKRQTSFKNEDDIQMNKESSDSKSDQGSKVIKKKKGNQK